MSERKIVKFNHIFEKNVKNNLKCLNFQNTIETELKLLNNKIEKLNKKIDEQHLENIKSDEILLQKFRGTSLQNVHDRELTITL